MELIVEQQHAFVARAIAGRRRILEVGCGRGELARRLAADGFAVTALDRELRDVVEAPGVTYVERDFLAYEAAPFDAVVFTASLHHIAPLADAIARARALGPRIVVDDFDLDAPDATTLAWYYDVQDLLVAAEVYAADRLDPPAATELARWRDAHVHHDEPPLHTGAQMLAALGDCSVTRGPYLYRYLCGGLLADARGGRIARQLLAAEIRRCKPVGLQAIAQSHSR